MAPGYNQTGNLTITEVLNSSVSNMTANTTGFDFTSVDPMQIIALIGGLILLLFILTILRYVLHSYFMMKTAQKLGYQSYGIVWIPYVKFFVKAQLAGWHVAWGTLQFAPSALHMVGGVFLGIFSMFFGIPLTAILPFFTIPAILLVIVIEMIWFFIIASKCQRSELLSLLNLPIIGFIGTPLYWWLLSRER